MSVIVPVVIRFDQNGAISTSPEPVPVTNPDTLIVFVIDSARYAFKPQDALVVEEGVHIDENFPYSPWTTTSSTAALFNSKFSLGQFKYTINMIDLVSMSPVSYDPSIINGTADPQ